MAADAAGITALVRGPDGASSASDDAAGIDDAAAARQRNADSAIATAAAFATGDARATITPAAARNGVGVREARPTREQHAPSTAATAACASAVAVHIAHATAVAAGAARATGDVTQIVCRTASLQNQTEGATATATATATVDNTRTTARADIARAAGKRACIDDCGVAAYAAALASFSDGSLVRAEPAVSASPAVSG